MTKIEIGKLKTILEDKVGNGMYISLEDGELEKLGLHVDDWIKYITKAKGVVLLEKANTDEVNQYLDDV